MMVAILIVLLSAAVPFGLMGAMAIMEDRHWKRVLGHYGREMPDWMRRAG